LHARGEQIKDILDADTHTPDARPAAALLGVESNSTKIAHLTPAHIPLWFTEYEPTADSNPAASIKQVFRSYPLARPALNPQSGPI
jgi:hypothetical protein